MSASASGGNWAIAVDPPAEPPTAVLRDSQSNERVAAYVYEWVFDGSLRKQREQTPVPWPDPLKVDAAVTVSADSVPPPSYTELRLFSSVGDDGTPAGPPFETLICDAHAPETGLHCLREGPTAATRVQPPPGRSYLTLFATWNVSTEFRARKGVRVDISTLSAAWLFVVDSRSPGGLA